MRQHGRGHVSLLSVVCRAAAAKLVEFFRAHPRDADKALRVSRYLTDDPHVRFSVWDESGVATAAISLDEAEAERLARFLARPVARSLRDRLASLVRSEAS